MQQMDSGYRGNGSGEDYYREMNSSRKDKKHYHRHSSEQIQQLETFFKDYPHPDENQRRQLSRELGLEPKQIKFWFQNRRTQAKAQTEREDNNALRAENERFLVENLAMKEAMKNIFCPKCDDPSLEDEERIHRLQVLKMENAQLKEQYEQISTIILNSMGKPIIRSPSTGSLHEENFLATELGIGGQPLIENIHRNISKNNSITPTSSFTLAGGLHKIEKGFIIEVVVSAMDEVIKLIQVDEPLWTRTLDEGRFVIHRENYDNIFPKGNFLRSNNARTESSKDSGIVTATPIELIEMCLDPSKWMNFFPTIVSKARIIEVLDTGTLGGTLQLMYEKMHILSPMVAPRDFIFLRYCRQLEESTWLMVDVSYDAFREIETSASHAWRLPSGCLIQDLHNGNSKVTWVEHVQVDDKKQQTHRLYRDLICGVQAYGAKRWIVTLQRMYERHRFFLGLLRSTPPKHELERVVNAPQGRKILMQLSQRIVKSFYEILSMGDKVDFPNMTEMNNSGVRISLRKSTGTGEPEGMVVCAATSVWLPYLLEHLFNFFRDDQMRARWDVLSNGIPITELACISTGTHPGNCVSIIQPFASKEKINNILMLQESCIHSLEAHVIYAPIDFLGFTSAINGGDPVKIPILSSGFVISCDGRPEKKTLPSMTASRSNSRAPQEGGSLLTVAFQILANSDSFSKQLNMDYTATVHALIGSTIQKIKAALGCSDLD